MTHCFFRNIHLYWYKYWTMLLIVVELRFGCHFRDEVFNYTLVNQLIVFFFKTIIVGVDVQLCVNWLMIVALVYWFQQEKIPLEYEKKETWFSSDFPLDWSADSAVSGYLRFWWPPFRRFQDPPESRMFWWKEETLLFPSQSPSDWIRAKFKNY